MLKGKKVTLRGVRREDLPHLSEFNNDIEVETSGGGDPPMPQSLERLQAEFDQNSAKGGRDGAWFVIEADGKVIGQCVLHSFDTCQGINHNCELGIVIGDKAYWGKGYGREAVNLLVGYAFHHWNVHRVWLRTNSGNERAIRAYLACGFVEEGRLREHEWNNGRFVDTVMMGILRREWEKINQA